ncbi:MAG: hypothetical protein KDG52_12090 [Rhodocyclaceae bacterium]|nr:hypothetical protein [Rhodocyclaceae bacterium]
MLNFLMKISGRLVREESAAAASEYAIVVGFVALAALVAASQFDLSGAYKALAAVVLSAMQ